uniref:Autophagy-related protein 17 n=1 Tax=Candida boidinii TaxID=5477 RepID=A0A0B6VK40_CANBO|nr:autophagy-related protein 17 [[Candida] boidinii]
MDFIAEIEFLRDDARLKLQEATKICNDADNSLIKTNEYLNERDITLPKLIFIVNSLDQQLRLITIIKNSLILKFNDLINLNNKLINKLTKNLKKFENLIKVLKNIKIDKSFNDTNNNHDYELTLFDFISEELVNELINDSESLIQDNSISNKINKTNSLIIRFESDINNLKNNFKNLKLLLENINHTENEHNLNNINNNNKDIIDYDDNILKLFKINQELESELVSLLQSFNNHYDQCNKGYNLIINNENNNENNNNNANNANNQINNIEILNFLKNDYNQLPNNLNLLNDCSIQIIKNSNEILNLIDLNFNKLKFKIEKILIKFKEKFKNLNEFLIEFKKNLNDFSFKIKNLKLLIKKIKLISINFKNFIKSYYNLIIEIDRRFNLNLKINKLINEFKLNSNNLINDNFKLKENFLNLNGDYLPKNLISNLKFNNILSFENNLNLINIDYNFEILPNLNKNLINEAKNYLNK